MNWVEITFCIWMTGAIVRGLLVLASCVIVTVGFTHGSFEKISFNLVSNFFSCMFWFVEIPGLVLYRHVRPFRVFCDWVKN